MDILYFFFFCWNPARTNLVVVLSWVPGLVRRRELALPVARRCPWEVWLAHRGEVGGVAREVRVHQAAVIRDRRYSIKAWQELSFYRKGLKKTKKTIKTKLLTRINDIAGININGHLRNHKRHESKSASLALEFDTFVSFCLFSVRDGCWRVLVKCIGMVPT